MSNTAAALVPTFVTVADAPGERVVTVPTAMVAALPTGPWLPVAPVSPRGIPKFSTAAAVVPTLVTVADAPGERVVVVPTLTEAAGPGVPIETVMDEGDPSTETSSVP
jgi:hypothetical protein